MSQAIRDALSNDYAAVRDGGAGLLDLSSRGRMLVSGSDAEMFLNGLVTNDVKTLAVNSWMPAAFANVQGRLLAAVRIIHRQDGFLIDTEEATHQRVWKLLERFTLAGDFRVTDLTGTTTVFSIQGKAAPDFVRAEFGREAEELGRQAVLRTAAGVDIFPATHTSEKGFDIFLDRNYADELGQRLMRDGVVPVNDETQELLRIEAGIPHYGIDMDETTVVTETNLDDAISFTKGCYVGQEIIIRIQHRGHVANKLTGIVLEDREDIENSAKISSDNKEIGRVTSATFSPRLERTGALGYVKYDYLNAGTKVSIASGQGEFPATVVELPFVRGSWYEEMNTDRHRSQF